VQARSHGGKAAEDEAQKGGVHGLVLALRAHVHVRGLHRDVRVAVVPTNHAALDTHKHTNQSINRQRQAPEGL
jgi:hypothetical protein